MIRKLPRSARLVRGGLLPLPMPQSAALDDTHPFAVGHLWLPLMAWALAVCTIGALDIDWHLSRALYAWEGYRWLLRDATLTEAVLHRGGHALCIAAWLGTLGAWIVARRRGAALQRPLAFLLLSVLASTLLVSWIKSWSNMDCPWDIDGLGGTRPYLDLLSPRPSGLPQGRCFPAGHASGGYAWVGLYFVFLAIRPAWRWRGLAIGLGIGALFGLAQQLRGAHFLSHDLWTLAICWCVAYVLRSAMLKRAPPCAGARRAIVHMPHDLPGIVGPGARQAAHEWDRPL
jgi:membrane-associated PAP2 superfamily phosphatase